MSDDGVRVRCVVRSGSDVNAVSDEAVLTVIEGGTPPIWDADIPDQVSNEDDLPDSIDLDTWATDADGYTSTGEGEISGSNLVIAAGTDVGFHDCSVLAFNDTGSTASNEFNWEVKPTLTEFFECVLSVEQDPETPTLYGFSMLEENPYGDLVPNEDVLGLTAWSQTPNLAVGNLQDNPEGTSRRVYCSDIGVMADLPWDASDGIWISTTGNAATIGAYIVSMNGNDVNLSVEKWEGDVPEPESFQITIGSSGSNRGWSFQGTGALVPYVEGQWDSMYANTSFNRIDLSPSVDSPELPDPLEGQRTFAIPEAGIETIAIWFAASWVWRITDQEPNGQDAIDYFINNVDETFEIQIGPIEYP